MPKFREWVENIANGQLVRICRPRGPIPAPPLPTRLSSPTPQVGFFAELGEYLSESIAEQLAHPERYAHEQSVTRLAIWASRGRGMPNRTYGPAARQLWALRVLATTRLDTSPICSGMQVMRVYLEEGALENNDVDGVVGLLTMTLMAAVFNTQVSLAWILVHLYSQPELLAMARRELEGCSDLTDYSQLQKMEARARARAAPCAPRATLLTRLALTSPRQFVNSCIDESVRLHTMLPGNTVLRKTVADVSLLDVQIPAGSLIWLYPNAVHQDEQCAPPTSNRSLRTRAPQLGAGTSPGHGGVADPLTSLASITARRCGRVRSQTLRRPRAFARCVCSRGRMS